MTPRARHEGLTLLPVVLAMSIVAAVAYTLNRAHGINVRLNTQSADMERARYAAEAGLQAVNFAVQTAGCNGTYPTASLPLVNSGFGGASYSAHSTLAGGSPVTLVSKGTYNGTEVTLQREQVVVYEPRQTVVVQPDPGTGADTFVDVGQERNFGGDTRLRLQSAHYQPLVKIALSSRIATGSRVVPWFDTVTNSLRPGAVLSLYQFDIASSGVGTLKLDAYAITRTWLAGTKAGGGSPNGATWRTYDGNNPWPAIGRGYGPTAAATTPYTGQIGWVEWDLTQTTAGWLLDPSTNNGVWIVETGGTIGNTGYVASNDTATPAYRPKMTVSAMQPCGAQRSLPLAADAFLSSVTGEQTSNFGAAAVMSVNQGAPERRIVVRFDVSSIAPGTVVKRATLRLYSRAVAAPTNFSKTIRAYYVLQPWTEGVTTWIAADATTPWSAAGGYAYWNTVLGTARDEVSGASPLPGSFRQGWVAFDLTSMAQAWVDKQYANYGILLRSESSTDIIEFESRESANGTAPQLVVVYQ